MWHGVRRFSFAEQSALRVGGVALEERRGGRRKALGAGGGLPRRWAAAVSVMGRL